LKRKNIVWWIAIAIIICLAVILIITIIQEPRLATNNQMDSATETENLTHPEVCIQQWREELMTMEDTLRCIDRYMEYNK